MIRPRSWGAPARSRRSISAATNRPGPHEQATARRPRQSTRVEGASLGPGIWSWSWWKQRRPPVSRADPGIDRQARGLDERSRAGPQPDRQLAVRNVYDEIGMSIDVEVRHRNNERVAVQRYRRPRSLRKRHRRPAHPRPAGVDGRAEVAVIAGGAFGRVGIRAGPGSWIARSDDVALIGRDTDDGVAPCADAAGAEIGPRAAVVVVAPRPIGRRGARTRTTAAGVGERAGVAVAARRAFRRVGARAGSVR